MLTAFLIGLAATVLVGIIAFSIKWLVGYIKKRLEKNKGKKVVFAKLQDIIDDEMKEKINASKTMSLEDLERMCDETPYVSAVYDEDTDTVDEYEGFQAESVDAQFNQKMKENDGMIVVGA